jgi:DNA repair protein RadC
MKESFTIHDLPLSERPRERLFNLGIEALSAQELIAVLLGRGIKGESVMVTAQNLLSKFGNLKNIAAASVTELSEVKGVGPAKAAQIKAAFELSKRLEGYPDRISNIKINSPESVISLVRNRLKGKKKEHFLIVVLDTRNHPIDVRTVSIGSLDSSIVHPREVFKEAISHSAASVIFVHNHPSGDPEPSKDDIQLTKQLIEAGKLLGIEVLDHLIICDNDYLSMKAKNII